MLWILCCLFCIADEPQKAEFSKDDVQQTVRWLDRLHDQYLVKTGNPLVDEENELAHQKELKVVVGKKIKYEMEVQTLRTKPFPNISLKGHYSKRSGKVRSLIVVISNEEAGLFLIPDLSEFRKMREGTNVLVSGKITYAQFSQATFALKLWVENDHVEIIK